MAIPTDTKLRDDDESNFIAPFLIAFFSGMLVAGFCAFLHVLITNALTNKRLEYLPDPRRVRVKKKKGKKGKKSKKSKGTTTDETGTEKEDGTGTKTGTKTGGSVMGTTATGKSKMSTAKEKTDKTTEGGEGQ